MSQKQQKSYLEKPEGFIDTFSSGSEKITGLEVA